MKSIRKIRRVGQRLLQGEDVTKVVHSQAEWDRQFQTGAWDFLLRTPYNVAASAVMIEHLSTQSARPLRILDVGCGNGALACKLAHLTIDYTGTDISQVALDEASKLYPAGTFVCASMEELFATAGEYDLIVFSEVLLYGTYQKILQVHRPALAPGGKVLVSLYDTWRTKWIWWRIRSQLQVLESVTVTDEYRSTRWRIKLATLV